MGQTSAAILKVNGRKIGEATEATGTVKSNGQLMVTADDIIKSKGKPTGEITFGAVVPTGGMTTNAVLLTLSQEVIAATMQYGGGLIEVVGTFDQAAIKTSIAQGSTDGNFTLSGSVRVIR